MKLFSDVSLLSVVPGSVLYSCIESLHCVMEIALEGIINWTNIVQKLRLLKDLDLRI